VSTVHSFQETLDVPVPIGQQEMEGVPNEDKGAERRDASTDRCEAGVAREAAGENSADDFVAKLIASGVPIITSDEMLLC
jgi:hypothetical protein